MPISNLGTKHVTATQISDANTHLAAIEAIAVAITQNLTDEERKKFGSVNEQNKLLVNKVNDYHTNQQGLQSPDVDWAEFDKDFIDRDFAGKAISRLEALIKMFSDFKIVHDYDNYQNSLTDYSYAQYKASTNTPGFAAKEAELKQFFPRTGSGGDTPPANG